MIQFTTFAKCQLYLKTTEGFSVYTPNKTNKITLEIDNVQILLDLRL